MKLLIWLLVLAVAIAAIVIVVLVWTERAEVEEQELAVLEHELKEEYWGPVVEGIAQNDTELVLVSAKAKVRWYGPADVALGTNFDIRLTRLQPGETWHFEVRSLDVSFEEVSRYELEVTGIIE